MLHEMSFILSHNDGIPLFKINSVFFLKSVLTLFDTFT